MLKETFFTLLTNYTTNQDEIELFWNELERAHQKKNRHYHTLTHLENVLHELISAKDEIKNWNMILFTLFYHDSVYNVLKSNNEEKSADLASKRMHQLNIDEKLIEGSKLQILATKSHDFSTNSDTNLFTDADLSILGQNWENYCIYCKNVRKEYSIYPDFVYNPGRKKVLSHFLQMHKIFKTVHFSRLENQAKFNIQKELELL